MLLVETKRPDAAFRLMNNWAQQNPRSSDARVELARLYEEYGDTNSAEGILQVALQTDVNNPRALAALGRRIRRPVRKCLIKSFFSTPRAWMKRLR